MQVEEESPKQYVDIARAPDKEMRPRAVACRPRGVFLPYRRATAEAVAQRPVPPGCGQDGRLLRYPPRQYRHIAFVGRLASGPSWPQRITRLAMKQVLAFLLLAALVQSAAALDRAAVERLGYGDSEERLSAIAALVAEGDPRASTVLQALAEGELKT